MIEASSLYKSQKKEVKFMNRQHPFGHNLTIKEVKELIKACAESREDIELTGRNFTLKITNLTGVNLINTAVAAKPKKQEETVKAIDEGYIGYWTKQVGDTIKKGEVLGELTVPAMGTQDIVAPFSGTITQLFIENHIMVHIGQSLYSVKLKPTLRRKTKKRKK